MTGKGTIRDLPRCPPGLKDWRSLRNPKPAGPRSMGRPGNPGCEAWHAGTIYAHGVLSIFPQT
jgi:hypothetical protein